MVFFPCAINFFAQYLSICISVEKVVELIIVNYIQHDWQAWNYIFLLPSWAVVIDVAETCISLCSVVHNNSSVFHFFVVFICNIWWYMCRYRVDPICVKSTVKSQLTNQLMVGIAYFHLFVFKSQNDWIR